MLLFKLNLLALTLLQAEIGFDLRSMWNQSGIVAKSVIIVLAIMSAWSIGVMIDRVLAYSAARKQSREFAPLVAGCLKEGKIDEAINVSEQNKKSHLAKVVVAGLQEFQAHQSSSRNTRRSYRSLQARFGPGYGHHERRTEAWHQRLGDHRQHRALRRIVRNGVRHHQRVPGHVVGKVHRSFSGGGWNF